MTTFTAPPRRPRRRIGSFFSALLIVLGCVLAPLSAVAVWASNQVGDTDRYVATVEPLADDPAVQTAVANRVTDAVMDHVDAAALLKQAAPGDRPALERALGRIDGPLDKAMRSFVHATAERVVEGDGFATVWTQVNRAAHASVNKALTGEGRGAVKLENDAATVDLAPVVERVKERLAEAGLPAADRIPEVHTELTLVQSEDIGKARTGFRLLQAVGNWLPVIALVLLTAGVLLAARRRRALAAAALGVALAVAVLGIALTVFRGVYLDALPSGVSRPAAESVYDTLIRFLRTGIRMLAVLGIVVALGAWLTGRGRRAAVVRGMWQSGLGAARSAAAQAGLRTGPLGPWVHRWKRWLTWGVVAAATLALILWHAPTGLVVLLLALAAVAALAVVEFLDSGSAEPSSDQVASG